MACGVPVIGSAVGGLLDTVEDGVTGRLIPPRRSDLLSDAIAELLKDPVRRAAMGRAGVRRVRQRYCWDEIARQTESTYAHVLRSRRDLSPASGMSVTEISA
jgi:D-inositol-3-phosphate glycosyltransferase